MTILERLTTSIGLSEQRARDLLRGGFVRVGRGDGVVVTDLSQEVELAVPVRFQPSVSR